MVKTQQLTGTSLVSLRYQKAAHKEEEGGRGKKDLNHLLGSSDINSTSIAEPLTLQKFKCMEISHHRGKAKSWQF